MHPNEGFIAQDGHALLPLPCIYSLSHLGLNFGQAAPVLQQKGCTPQYDI